MTRNKIDLIIAEKRHIFKDVSVVNRLNNGSNHRLLQGTEYSEYITLKRVGLLDEIYTPTYAAQITMWL